MFTGRKLPLTLGFGVLLGLAFGVSCKGFFPDSVLQSIAVGPASQTIQTGNTNNQQQFTAVGTYNDGTRTDNKVTWSVSPGDGKALQRLLQHRRKSQPFPGRRPLRSRQVVSNRSM